jgi:hypothetical protein
MPFLTEARVRTALPQDKAYKLFDSLGLYLKVETSGGRLWRFKYHHAGVEKLLSLGRYPEVWFFRFKVRSLGFLTVFS